MLDKLRSIRKDLEDARLVISAFEARTAIYYKRLERIQNAIDDLITRTEEGIAEERLRKLQT